MNEPTMRRAYFEASIEAFLGMAGSHVLGELTKHHGHALDLLQRNAWLEQIAHLKQELQEVHGHILFEYAIPRMGKRADVVLVAGGLVFVIEYKVGADTHSTHAIDQVLDYALDLKNFHSGSHHLPIVPVVCATNGPDIRQTCRWFPDRVAEPVLANRTNLGAVLLAYADEALPTVDYQSWLDATYRPTPTIVEAAKALYEGHRVEEISRSDAGAINLTRMAKVVGELLERAKAERKKTICFVTGVPGSGKTLAGLNLATQRMRAQEDEHAVFLSGNGPLVAVLREALARDEAERARAEGRKLSKKEALQKASTFVQNIHHFRDESLRTSQPPAEKVVVFDEAQRAWTLEQASRFMREKRETANFEMSEPQFLLSVMDRHDDWCLVVCLIGGGQEINTGEAGLSEWFKALGHHFPHWRVAYSDRLQTSDYSWGSDLERMLAGMETDVDHNLHLAVNVRSFRAESVSAFVAAVLDGDETTARKHMENLDRYPIVLTRSLEQTRAWLRRQARGTERYGLVASSNGLRLKPVGLHVKAKINPANWFLNPKGDVRSSFALEDVASEFDIQGLELDWVGVCWDANLRFVDGGWSLHAFRGSNWQNVNDFHKRIYLANTYRVLLTRARQGMVIFVPEGAGDDPTRHPRFYDGTLEYLVRCGVPMVVD